MTRWRLERTQQAEDDLFDIWAYIAADNPEAAGRLFIDLVCLFEKTADFPMIGRSADEFGKGYRVLSYRRYLLFYRLDTPRHVVQLMRVAHGARDISSLFRDA